MKQHKPSIGKIIAVIGINSLLSACMLVSSIFQQPTYSSIEYTSTSTANLIIPSQTEPSPTRTAIPQTIPSFTQIPTATAQISPSPEPSYTPTFNQNADLTIGDSLYDQYDQIIMVSLEKYGLNSDIGMIVKAMIHEESKFNPLAISRWDKSLPCRTHSYGLMQITPGCRTEFAVLPEGTKPTAEISFGLDGIPAVLIYHHKTDKKNGNTVVKEDGLIINLISNPSNHLYATSAFNPAYNIDTGIRALSASIDYMKENFICSDKEYLAMGLAGYNAGKKNITGCLEYSDKGQSYVNKIFNEYRQISKLAGIEPIY